MIKKNYFNSSRLFNLCVLYVSVGILDLTKKKFFFFTNFPENVNVKKVRKDQNSEKKRNA